MGREVESPVRFPTESCTWDNLLDRSCVIAHGGELMNLALVAFGGTMGSQ